MTHSTTLEQAETLLAPIGTYIETVLERCGDRYGDVWTPLLVDSIALDTDEPACWRDNVLSNFACQQNFLRTLVGFGELADASEAQARAEEWTAHALNAIEDPASGLFYWGGHATYDLQRDRPLIGSHELKCVYPNYPYLYEQSPERLTRFFAAFWNRHVRDWSTLLFNRHGEYRAWDATNPWEHDYRGGPLPIIENSALSFINTGSDLINAATQATLLTGNSVPLQWARHLLSRYDEIRHPETGLGGYQFNHRDPCRVRISFRPPFNEQKSVNETTVITSGVIQTRFGRAAVIWLTLAEALGEEAGASFVEFACRDLLALAEYAYDPETAEFVPLLNDGTRLAPENCIEGAGYCSPRGLARVRVTGVLWLAYAKAYRHSKSPDLWRVARELGIALGWDFLRQTTSDTSAQITEIPARITLPSTTGVGLNEACSLTALLELHRATEQECYLSTAIRYAQQLMDCSLQDGLFCSSANADRFVIDHTLPVALLQLVAQCRGTSTARFAFLPNSTSFDPKIIARSY